MLKIEDLRVGDEVECVSSFHVEIKEKDLLEVTGVNERSIAFMSIKNGNKYTFNKSYMDCFKKIEKYTFDDLIDRLSKPVKDKISYGFKLINNDKEIIAYIDGSDSLVIDLSNINDSVKLIESLYKETFVIETVEDIKNIEASKRVDSIKLANDMILSSDDLYAISHCTNDFLFKLLKGATVEQSK